jgi:hypothetical protein
MAMTIEVTMSVRVTGMGATVLIRWAATIQVPDAAKR